MADLGQVECLDDEAPPTYTPKEVPVSIEEIDNSPPMDMDLPVKEPCGSCQGPMKVGDYVCWGICYQCMKDEEAEHGTR